jgi:adhesin/invasin
MIPRTSDRVLPGACFAACVSLLASLVIGGCSKVPLLAPTGSTLTLTAGATTLSLGGSTDLIVQVFEQPGTAPQDGTLVSFTTTLGSVQPSDARTSGGRVNVKFFAGSVSGVATITATSGPASGGTTNPTNVAKISIGSAAAGSVSVTASPGAVPATGGSSTITATVLDTNGNLLAGVPVTFTTDNGTVSPALATTGANGQTTSTLTTTKVSKVTATAGVASTSGTTTTTAPSASVIVNVNTGPSVSIAGPASPTNGTASTFTITVVPTAPATITDVTVDFGDGTPKVDLGATSTSGSGTVSVQHVYASVSTYTATVSAVDSNGLTASASTVIVVTPAPPLAVTLTNTAPAPAGGFDAITFTATVTGGTGASFAWDFGDGSAAVTTSGNVVNHIYTAGAVVRTATVTVTATTNQTASTQISLIP